MYVLMTWKDDDHACGKVAARLRWDSDCFMVFGDSLHVQVLVLSQTRSLVSMLRLCVMTQSINPCFG